MRVVSAQRIQAIQELFEEVDIGVRVLDFDVNVLRRWSLKC